METKFTKITLLKFGLFATLTVFGSQGNAGNFEQILDCDNGAAVIEVDTGARTQVQVKLHNQKIIQYLTRTIENAFNNSSSWRLLRQGQPSNSENADEMSIGAFSENGIFASNQFRSAGSATAYGLQFSAYRDGGGLKVIFKMPGGWRCSEGGHFDYQSCIESGNVWYLEPDQEISNWYFNSCQLR